MKSAEQEKKIGMITALIVEPNAVPYVKKIAQDWRSLREIVGGPIEGIYPFEDSVSIVCNEEGKVLGLAPNRALFGSDGHPYDMIAGTFLIVGAEEDKETYSSLSDEMIRKYSDLFREPYCPWFYVL